MSGYNTTIDHLPESVCVKHQEKKYGPEYFTERGTRCRIRATVRYDDCRGNGHNTFSITAEIYRHNGRHWEEDSFGCLHKEVARRFPKLAPYLKWHLVSSDGPMHYVGNTLYYARDRYHWGLRKGEKKQILKGGHTPSWRLTLEDGRETQVQGIKQYEEGHEQPAPPAKGLIYSPWCHVGEGKERDLDAARRCAVWPEATDEELLSDDLADRLVKRLPALMKEFKQDVESFGFTY